MSICTQRDVLYSSSHVYFISNRVEKFSITPWFLLSGCILSTSVFNNPHQAYGASNFVLKRDFLRLQKRWILPCPIQPLVSVRSAKHSHGDQNITANPIKGRNVHLIDKDILFRTCEFLSAKCYLWIFKFGMDSENFGCWFYYPPLFECYHCSETSSICCSNATTGTGTFYRCFQ